MPGAAVAFEGGLVEGLVPEALKTWSTDPRRAPGVVRGAAGEKDMAAGKGKGERVLSRPPPMVLVASLMCMLAALLPLGRGDCAAGGGSAP